MSYAISNSSPLAAEAAAKAPSVGKTNRSYPFDRLNVGQSFAVPMDGANIKSLRTRASQKSVLGKRFVVVTHEDMGVYEVARVACSEDFGTNQPTDFTVSQSGFAQ